MRWSSKKVWKWAIVVVLLAAVAGAFLFWNNHRQQWLLQAQQYRELARAEKDWILQCQMEDGLILYREWDPDFETEEQTVVPYFSSIAALGLLSGTVTEEQVQGALAYQTWYLDHLNDEQQDPVDGRGTMFDYLVTRSGAQVSIQSTGRFDSVDSYAALFLLVADRYADVVSPAFAHERAEDLLVVVDVLLRTLDSNGLACTKTEYPVQYLMDNCEVYAGLRAAADLLEQIEPDGARLKRTVEAADALLEAMERFLWDSQQNQYYTGIFEERVLKTHAWEEFYPDGVSQLFPMCFGILEPASDRSAQLYNAFCAAWDWETMDVQRREINQFYWCLMAYAAALQEDEPRLQLYLQNYQAVLQREGRQYPLYTGDSGWMALACSQMEEYYQNKFWW